MNQIAQLVESALGLTSEPSELQIVQMILRALIICFATQAMMRLAGRRFLAQKSPFDVMLAFITASMMSRAINGSAAFFGTLGTGLVIAAAYRALAYGACMKETLRQLPPFDSKTGDLNVIIETPKGSRNKYAYEETGLVRLKKLLPHGMVYPLIMDSCLQPAAETAIRWMF